MGSFLSFLKWKCSKSAQNVMFNAILTYFWTIWPTQKSLTLPKEYVKGIILSQNTPWNITTRKLIHFYLFEVKMFEKCPKCNILCSFGPFWDHVTHSEAPYSTNKKHLRVQILPKVSINCYYQKKNSFISFWSENVWEVPKCLISCNFDQFSDHITHWKTLYTIKEVR